MPSPTQSKANQRKEICPSQGELSSTCIHKARDGESSQIAMWHFQTQQYTLPFPLLSPQLIYYLNYMISEFSSGCMKLLVPNSGGKLPSTPTESREQRCRYCHNTEGIINIPGKYGCKKGVGTRFINYLYPVSPDSGPFCSYNHTSFTK